MSTYVNFHTQLASIMEVLANAAVAEICQLVDDGFSNLRLEMSRTQRENLALKSKLRLMEVRSGDTGPHREHIPPLVVTCIRKDHCFGEELPIAVKRNVTSTILGNSTQQSKLVPEQLVEPEVVVIKEERLEEDLMGCSLMEANHTTLNSSIGPQSSETDHPVNIKVSLSITEVEAPRISLENPHKKENYATYEAQQDERVEASKVKVTQTGKGFLAQSQSSSSAEQNHGGIQRDVIRTQDTTDLTKEDHSCVPADSLSNKCKVSNAQTPLVNLETDLPVTSTGKDGLCGASADWSGQASEVSAAVKMEAEPSWCGGTRSRFTDSNSLSSQSNHTESEPAEGKCCELDSFDSSSFDDLFSSPEVARSLTALHSTDTAGGMEDRLSSSSFQFLSSGTQFGNHSASVSDSIPLSSFSNPPSDSRSRVFPSSTERAFSCQQCGRHFSASRDLVVHQRCHTGERIYHCHLCKKPFIHPHQLKTHQRVHTGEKPFSCTQCGKRFSQSSHIKRHMSVHTGEKRYSCSLCGKRFSQACSLKVHQAVHTGERPYSCTHCGKSFSVLGNLVRHQSVHISK
ncbi:zinc finger protein 252-like isoform X2 [Sphaeramia orbicularis]|uniref:zinc finger protein 252-like isoform X2 n=1 Tax=Sphaeramia orbicularis TaxID=375764 RepID=UPI00117C671A|nr:zinc finger protein 252-like isoform X2 [Sphaeramia orbicularis]